MFLDFEGNIKYIIVEKSVKNPHDFLITVKRIDNHVIFTD